MTARFIHDGNSIDYTPGANVAAGDVIVLNSLIGIAKLDIPANTLGALALTGVFEINAEPMVTYNIGVPVYWNASEDYATTDNDGGTRPLIGYVTVASPAASSQTVRVLLR